MPALAHILLPKDYVRYRLTGEYAMDKADGAGHDAVRPASARLVAGSAGGAGHPAGLDAADLRRPGDHRAGHRRSGRGDRAEGRHAGGGRRRRPGGRRRWAWARSSQGIVALTLGTSGVVFATTDAAVDRAGRPPARLLPCRAGQVAPDGRDALGGRQPALVPRHACAGHELRRPAGTGSRDRPAGQRRAALPALPDRRAHAAPRPAGARRLRRPDRAPRPRRT